MNPAGVEVRLLTTTQTAVINHRRQFLFHFLYLFTSNEIDRAIKFAALALNPIECPPQYHEKDVVPLSQSELYNESYKKFVPSASVIYATLLSHRNQPLNRKFGRTLARVAPYLTFQQVDYILTVRPDPFMDWGEINNHSFRRIKYIHSVKKKVKEIGENYGGLSFLPQSFLVSIFLGEATRGSLDISTSDIDDDDDNDDDDDRKSPSFRRSRLYKSSSNLRAAAQSVSPRKTKHRVQYRQRSENDLPSLAARSTRGFNVAFENENENENENDDEGEEQYQLATSLLGPSDVAVLIQAGLASPVQSSVVQLNQRILINLVDSQPSR